MATNQDIYEAVQQVAKEIQEVKAMMMQLATEKKVVADCAAERG